MLQDLLVDVVRASSVHGFKLILDLSYMRIFRFHIGDEGLPPMPFETYLRDMDVDAYADTLRRHTEQCVTNIPHFCHWGTE